MFDTKILLNIFLPRMKVITRIMLNFNIIHLIWFTRYDKGKNEMEKLRQKRES